jgi:hypothetical protein
VNSFHIFNGADTHGLDRAPSRANNLTECAKYFRGEGCVEVSRVGMEELLESFVTAGLGLTLVSRIRDVTQKNLLSGFLVGTQGVQLGARLTDLNALPAACRALDSPPSRVHTL